LLCHRWWGVAGCSQDGAAAADAAHPPSLTIRDLAGLFSILAAAILLSAFIGMIEYNISRQRVENKRNRVRVLN